MSGQFSILVAAVLAAVGVSVFARLRSTRTAVDFQLAGQRVGVITNACAICGDYVSAASFLGVAAAVYVAGLDGAWYATGFAAGFVPVLLFVAAPLRRFGDRSIPDFLARRYNSEGVRLVSVAMSLLIILAYLIPQAVGGGLAWELFSNLALPGLTPYSTGIVASTLLTGVLVVIGGMRGTTWNQAMQFVVLLGILLWLASALVLDQFSYPAAVAELNGSPLVNAVNEGGRTSLAQTANQISDGPAYFAQPGARYSSLGQFALLFTLVFGTAGLPHVMNRFFTSPTGRAARMTTVWVLGLIGIFYTAAVMIGTAARSILQTRSEPWLDDLASDGILLTPEHALLALGRLYGGDVGLSAVTTGALLAIMSTIGGLLLAASASWGHDIYERYINRTANRAQALHAGQGAVAVMALAAALVASVLNPARFSVTVPSVIASLVTAAFALAGSTITPALILSIWSKATTGAGVATGMLVGGAASIACVSMGLFRPGSPDILLTPTLILGPVVMVVIIVVSKFTAPADNIEQTWVTMHGSASDRSAERLAETTVQATRPASAGLR